MVSYKNLYNELLLKIELDNKERNSVIETDFYCPLCYEKGIQSIILTNNSEYYCKNENCSYDILTSDMFIRYAEMRDLERID